MQVKDGGGQRNWKARLHFPMPRINSSGIEKSQKATQGLKEGSREQVNNYFLPQSFFFFFLNKGSYYVDLAGLNLLGSINPLASVSYVARTMRKCHYPGVSVTALSIVKEMVETGFYVLNPNAKCVFTIVTCLKI